MVEHATAILENEEVERLIQLALDEDGVGNDLTTRATGADASKSVRATIVAKKPTVLSGYPLVERVFRRANIEKTTRVSTLHAEGSALSANSPWIILEGRASDLLRIERTILNFLMRMSGIAHYTRQITKAIEGMHTRVLHTRKTAPGHRRTDIYAMLVGGAHPHRRALDDAILVKENHLRVAASFQSLTDGINKFRDKARFVEIEVTDFTELKHALAAKPNRIMLDNFSVKDVERAVNLFSGSVELEASGGISLENVREYASTGVDFISMGAPTHSAPAADLSMLFDFRN